jgi:hypothetical protein
MQYKNSTQASFVALIERIENLDREMREVKETLLNLKREILDNDEVTNIHPTFGENDDVAG